MKHFIHRAPTGLLTFYGICALVALSLFFFQDDPARTTIGILDSGQNQGYWDSLKFTGLFFVAAFVLIELAALALQRIKGAYDWGDTAASAGIYLINVFATPLTALYLFTLLKQVEQFAVFEIGDGLVPFLVTVILFEGAYYWYHRLSHEIPFLWSVHHAHHSAQTLNFSIAFRLHTFGRLISPIAYLPMILMGFKPEYILAGLFVSLIYQFFLHTQMVPKLGWVEHLGFNTPSKHRVHHGTNPYCIDKNYGGMLIIWDYFHGTYAEEDQPITYGVTTGFYSYNPLKILFRPQIDWLRGRFQRERDIAPPNALTESRLNSLTVEQHA